MSKFAHPYQKEKSMNKLLVHAPNIVAVRVARNPKVHSSVRTINRIGWALVFLLALYDVRLALDNIDGNTWSELMRSYGQRHLVLPWLCGVLVGHLFHHKDNLKPLGNLDSQSAYTLIFWLSAIFLVISVGMHYLSRSVPDYVMTIVALLGFLAGHFVWPIKREEGKWKW
jgi:hypothetical protein